eukprot:scaffold258986_cov15-Tisochrysis_lutea.AAC.1
MPFHKICNGSQAGPGPPLAQCFGASVVPGSIPGQSTTGENLNLHSVRTRPWEENTLCAEKEPHGRGT